MSFASQLINDLKQREVDFDVTGLYNLEEACKKKNLDIVEKNLAEKEYEKEIALDSVPVDIPCAEVVLFVYGNVPGTRISATKDHELQIYISKGGQIKIKTYKFEKGEKTSIIQYLKSFGYENIKFIPI